jgi:gas vesicle protein
MAPLGKFIAGFVMGGFLGSTLTIFLTPYSGEDTRTWIGQYVEKIKQEVQTAMAEQRKELENELSDLRKPLPPANQQPKTEEKQITAGSKTGNQPTGG